MKRYIFALLGIGLLLNGCAGQTDQNESSQTTAAAQTAQAELPAQEQDASFEGKEEAKEPKNSLSHDTAVEKPMGDMVEISERLFIAQTNDIYLNPNDYLGKTIKYEGLFASIGRDDPEAAIYYVIRYGPGCCGYDGEAGFEVAWDEEMPEDNAWCEAIGVLEMFEENGVEYLRLRLSSLKVLQERGAEFVNT